MLGYWFLISLLISVLGANPVTYTVTVYHDMTTTVPNSNLPTVTAISTLTVNPKAATITLTKITGSPSTTITITQDQPKLITIITTSTVTLDPTTWNPTSLSKLLNDGPTTTQTRTSTDYEFPGAASTTTSISFVESVKTITTSRTVTTVPPIASSDLYTGAPQSLFLSVIN